MRNLILLRLRESPTRDRTWGRLSVFDDFKPVFDFAALELGWKKNRRNVSRIPEGDYRVTVEQDPKRYTGVPFLRVHDVPGRTGVLAHIGCFPKDTEGCVLVGMTHADLDGDGLADNSRSKDAMWHLVFLLGGVGSEATIVVRDAMI